MIVYQFARDRARELEELQVGSGVSLHLASWRGEGSHGVACLSHIPLDPSLCRANFFFGPTFDLENFPTSGVKGRFLLEATPPVGHLLLQLRSSTLESHKATTRTALLNR